MTFAGKRERIFVTEKCVYFWFQEIYSEGDSSWKANTECKWNNSL